MVETPCKKCENKRKDCSDKQFNLCMAEFYLEKCNDDRQLATTIVEEIMAKALDCGKYRAVTVEMVQQLGE